MRPGHIFLLLLLATASACVRMTYLDAEEAHVVVDGVLTNVIYRESGYSIQRGPPGRESPQ